MSKKNRLMPVITMDTNGKFAVQIAEGAFITWWVFREGGQDHHYVRLMTPKGVSINEVPDGADLVLPTRH